MTQNGSLARYAECTSPLHKPLANIPCLQVLSFMSTFGGPNRSSPEQKASAQEPPQRQRQPPQPQPNYVSTEPTSSPAAVAIVQESPVTRTGRARAESRPVSMIGGYLPPQMDMSGTLPELLPIFTFLNGHSNKLYQEGYFLKLNDLDSRRSSRCRSCMSLC